MENKEIEKRLTALETKVDYLCAAVRDIKENAQRHVWALILLLAGTMIPLILKVFDIV